LLICISTLILYFIFFGHRHRRSRKQLEKDLREAMQRVERLHMQLDEKAAQEVADKTAERVNKPVRIFMDGAFDMMHYGHMNAFRQARALGDFLIVAINSDESITQCKGKPLMNEKERKDAVLGCKFVDLLIEEECPYVMTREFLEFVIDKYQIDYVVHGDDPCIVNGLDVYAEAKNMGKYKQIPRTEGISTTDLVGRMLLATKEHHRVWSHDAGENAVDSLISRNRDSSIANSDMFKRHSQFLTTGRMIRLFSVGFREPPTNARVVYMDGSFDMLHSGHMLTIKKARELGDYLIVGLHSDGLINEHLGGNLPIMNLHERVLSVLGCEYVDDVLIDAPYSITEQMVKSLNIAVVVHGSQGSELSDTITERYSLPLQAGIFQIIDSPTSLTVHNIIMRIKANEERYAIKFEKKKKQEEEYYQQKYGIEKEKRTK